MEPVGYLLRLRCSERRALGIKTATVARDRHDFGMLLKPFREALGGPLRKEIDDAAQVQIDQNRSVVLAFTPSPIVDAQVANRECGWGLRRGLANAVQNGVITGGDGQPGEKSLARQAAGHVADQANDFCGPIRLATISARDTGQSLAEDLALAGGIATTKPTDGRPQLDRHSLPRKILEVTTITAVARSRHFAAEWAGWFLLNVDPQSESFLVAFDTVEYQNARVRENGLRMARGSCHCLQSLKHFSCKVFRPFSCTKTAEEPLIGPVRQFNLAHPRDKRVRLIWAIALSGGTRWIGEQRW